MTNIWLISKRVNRRGVLWLWPLAFFLLSCGGSVDPVIKIGLVAPFEGALRVVGYDVIYSARLAVREVNAKGGINGYRIALVAYDDGSYAPSAVNVADSLVIDPAIIGVVGHWSAESNKAVRPIYDSAQLAFVPMDESNQGFDSSTLPDNFKQAYQAVTFQQAQAAGWYSAPAYDAMQLLFAAIAQTKEPTRATVFSALGQTEIDGLTGRVSAQR